jgi:hypothetical protein
MISTDLLLGMAVVVGLWFGTKIVDAIAARLVNEKIIEKVFNRIVRRIKIFRTRGDPVSATFSLSFTPEQDLTVSDAIDKLEIGFNRAEQASNGKISIESQHLDESDRDGKVEIHYSDATEAFNIDVDIIQDPDSIRQMNSVDPANIKVGSIGLDIEFRFPFHLLEDTLFNLGSLVNYLEDGFNSEIRGSFSDGSLVISPVEDGLTIDDWIEKEQFDISLLLTTEGEDRTEVEFFPDRAVVKSNQREIDAQTVQYTKELLLNYYL